MATSFKQPAGYAAARRTQSFSYPAMPSENSGGNAANAGADAASYPWGEARNPSGAAEDAQNQQRQIWQQGFNEGSARLRAEYEKGLTAQREEVGKALANFAVQRGAYFQRVEEQVVRLALAIARKILHREAQMDPLLLEGVVRVALEKLGSGAGTRLLASPADLAIWRSYFAQASGQFPAPELIGNPELRPGHCVLETDMGATEISLETQLQEIEQGFFDLLAQRPGASGEASAKAPSGVR